MSKVEVRVYDVTGSTYQSTLGKAFNVKWQHPLAGEGLSSGTLTFSLMASDPQASQLLKHRIVKTHWLGAERVGFRIQQKQRVLTDSGFRLDITAIQARCMLGDAVALGEYGVRLGAGETRRFGFMSPVGAWFESGEWLDPDTTPLSSYALWPAYPVGYPDGSSHWLAAPSGDQPPVGGKVWYRGTFTTSTTYPAVRLYVATDDGADVYLDGELIMQIESTPAGYLTANVANVTLPVGDHILAVALRDDYQWTGEGLRGELLCCLASVTETTTADDADAVVVSAIIFNSDDSSAWKVRSDNTSDPGWRKAQIVKQLFTEATARGVRGCVGLTLDFDDTDDSASVPWTDRGDYEVHTLDDPLDRITESLFDPSIDWDVDAATMTVKAWNRRGQDRTTGGSPVVFQLRKGTTDLAITEVYDVVSSLYGRTADGLIVHQSDPTAETEAGGVVEAGMSLGSVASVETAEGVMAAHLASLGYPTEQVTGAWASTGPVPYVDCELGDTVACEDGLGGYIAVRILSFTVDASGDTVVAFPEFAVDPTVTL